MLFCAALAGAALILLLGSSANCGAQAQRAAPSPAASPSATANPQAAFDAQRAWELLLAQTNFGPRNPGSEGHERCLRWLLEQMRSVADRAFLQEFTHTSTEMAPGKTFRMANVVGVIAAGRTGPARRVLLCAHWDTRPIADCDPNPANRTKPILGANDGASGVAVCLEVARALRVKRAPTEVVVVLFDGEDFGKGQNEEWFLGSKYFARHMGELRPARGILLDMVGDADLRLEWEAYSLLADRELMETIWFRAGALGFRRAFPLRSRPTASVLDDHIPLIEAGVPTVDLIDFDYPYWHTLQDTPDKCSAASLRAVGETVLAVLRRGI